MRQRVGCPESHRCRRPVDSTSGQHRPRSVERTKERRDAAEVGRSKGKACTRWCLKTNGTQRRRSVSQRRFLELTSMICLTDIDERRVERVRPKNYFAADVGSVCAAGADRRGRRLCQHHRPLLVRWTAVTHRMDADNGRTTFCCQSEMFEVTQRPMYRSAAPVPCPPRVSW